MMAPDPTGRKVCKTDAEKALGKCCDHRVYHPSGPLCDGQGDGHPGWHRHQGTGVLVGCYFLRALLTAVEM